MSVCFITDDVYFDQLVKIVSTKFFYYIVNNFLFDKYYFIYLETTYNLFLLPFLLTDFSLSVDLACSNYHCVALIMIIFDFPHSFFIINCNS